MGKGDIKTKRGKISNKSYGVRRKRKAEKMIVPAVPVKKEKEVKPEKPVETEVPVVIAEKKPIAKKPAAKKPKKEDTAE